jgi:integrase
MTVASVSEFAERSISGELEGADPTKGDFIPITPKAFVVRYAERFPEFATGEQQDQGVEPEFCNECGRAHAPGNVRRCRELAKEALADAIAARLNSGSAPDVVPVTEQLIDSWLSSLDGSTDPRTRREYGRIARAQWLRFFSSLDAIAGQAKDYTNARLKAVSRTMVLKELSALRGFVAWAHEHGHLKEAAQIPAPPRRAVGKHSTLHKRGAVIVNESEMERIVALLPEWTRARRGGTRHRVRDFFVFAWETGLRPITISRLNVPVHWRPGHAFLNITEDIDKARFGRELPLTPRAVAVLERCAMAQGLIFGCHDYRARLKSAAKAAGLDEERARHFSRYDFRHNRADFLLDQGIDLRAVAFNHGHKLLSTTDKYLRPSRKGAEAMIEKLAQRSGGSGSSGACTCRAEGAVDEPQLGEYTSVFSRTWRNWQTHQIQVLAP